MIEMLVCGLMAVYHVNCIQFYFYETSFNESYPGLPNSVYMADSDIEAGIGIAHIYDMNSKLKDACGNSILEHELQRFHQNRWDRDFCNVVKNA